ncbi:MAG: hypothetical protein ACRD2S_09045 [Terriglobales bacterium]
MAPCLWGQSAPRVASAYQKGSDQKTENKLTLKQQRGERLLQAAQAEAASLQPDMRTFILWKVAGGYLKPNPAKAETLLREAFLASVSIEDIAPDVEGGSCQDMVGCGIKTWLQRSVLQAMESSSDVEQLLAQVPPSVRKQVTRSLISTYIAKKNFDRARQLIASLADQNDYPYISATNLILALPKDSASELEKVAIFNDAMNAYERQGESQSYGGGYGGFDGMVIRFYKDIPTAMAEHAIDEILAKAKDADTDSPNLHLSFSTGSGAVALNSHYQYRLFELIPVLKQLDEGKAKSLIRDDSDIAAMLDRFPEGMQSVQPDFLMHPRKTGDTTPTFMSVSVGGGASPSINGVAVQAQQEVQRKRQEIITDSEKSPRQAIAEAMSLPEYIPSPSLYGGEGSCPRAEALLEIARKVGKGNSTVAKEALGETRKSLTQASPMTQARLLDDAAIQYLDIGAENGADETIKEALQIADRLYAKDTDADDPNKAFKGAWPSTSQWRRCVQIAARFSPATAENIITGIRDPEIASFEKIYFASVLLGSPISQTGTAVSTRSGTSFSSF